MRTRLLALVALVAMIGLPPWLLLTWGSADWGSVNVWTPLDVRLLTLVLTAVGWLAWLAWIVSLVLELARVASRGKLCLRVPFLGAGQTLAASLLTALFTSMPLAGAIAQVPSPIVAPERAVAASETAPDAALAAGVETTPDSGSPRAAKPDAVLRHRVGPGDDLWSLAEQYYGDGTQWRAIVAANPHLAADPLAELSVGDVLRVVEPVRRVTVHTGDSLWLLAGRHLGDPNRWPEIHILNRALIADPEIIQPGWVLSVPFETEAIAAEGLATASSDAGARGEPPVPAAPSSEAKASDTRQRPATGEGASEVVGAENVPADAPEATGAATPEAPDQHATDASDRNPDATDATEQNAAAHVAALVGGMTTLTAGAVLAGLTLRRRLQQAARPVGRRFIQPGDELRPIESAVAVRHGSAADTAEPVLDRELLATRALRHLSAHWGSEERPAPELERVIAGPVDIEFVFTAEQPSAPAGFQLLGRRIAASWNRLAGLDDPPHPVAYPALITLGTTSGGELHLVDLAGIGLLGITGGPLARQALSGMVIETTCAPWASEAEVLVVTGDPRFPEAVAAGHVTTTASVADGLAHLEHVAHTRRRFLRDGTSYDRARLDPDLAHAWAPHLVLFEPDLDADARARIAAATTGVPCGVAAVVIDDAATCPTTWQLAGTDDVRGTLRGVHPAASPLTLAAHTIPPPTRDALASLFDLAQADASEPAPWWAFDHPQEPDVNLVALRPAATGPLVRLLGPVELDGATADVPWASRQCIEYLTWLLEHPGATASQMASELLVAESTRRSNMSRLRKWLGSDADGAPYLPDAYSGRIHLHPGVSSDWHQLQRLVLGGVNRASTERLTAALDLVRGAPLADAAPGQWHWAEELRSDMVATIRDAGIALSRRARAERQLDLARWAVNRALAVAPDDELLLGERIRTEYAAGHLDEVERLAQRIHHTTRALGIDLLPETVDLLQEVMEGRLRARRA